MPKKKNKSWKERQRDRQIKKSRSQEAYRIRREKKINKKSKRLSKRKIIAVISVIVFILGVFAAWQFTIKPDNNIYIRADGSVNPPAA